MFFNFFQRASNGYWIYVDIMTKEKLSSFIGQFVHQVGEGDGVEEEIAISASWVFHFIREQENLV